MTQKPLAWLALALGSLLCLVLTWAYYEEAFPSLKLDISMSRDSALQAARSKVNALHLAASDAQAAVRFNTDGDAQGFIELEGGGKAAFTRMLQQDIYQALQWQVRFFKEKDANTTTVFFTPQGQPYGFARHVPENDPGAVLDDRAARTLAEAAAARDWGLNLAPGQSGFSLAEQSQQTRPSGRVDHTLTYERADALLGKNGEGRVRLQLTVSGDQLSELRHYVKIPQSFERRYAEMRSANSLIAVTGTVTMGLLYGVGGVLLGLIWLARQRWVLVRPPVKWALVIALLQAAAGLNGISSSWFGYDTAVAADKFVASQVVGVVIGFMATWLLLSVSFMAAESLSRRAFATQPQFWRLWTQGLVNSSDVLGRTVGGYLWVGFDLAFIVGFYYVTQHYWGWWSPLESLVDPNILATPAPWLEPVANAAHAGFWEEALFRAVPLAGAALWGDYLQRRFGGRLGSRKSWLVLALVLQAAIFGSLHATYAQQPSFARPVELFVPALVWGLIYLRFGLLPGILFHFCFDLLLMSLPIFMTSAPGLGLDRFMVILAGALPLLVVLWARWRYGVVTALDDSQRNLGWTPAAPVQQAAAPAAPIQAQTKAWSRASKVAPWVGAAALVGWVLASGFRQDGLPFALERTQAVATARAELQARGVVLEPQWQCFAAAERQLQDSDAYVWREAGAATYAKLLGRYLAPPLWHVRCMRFDGDVAERAEQWQVFVESGVDGQGASFAAPHVRNVWHELPEAQPGKSLTVDAARFLAHQAVKTQYGLTGPALREVVAKENKRPNRTDWNFVFAVDADKPTAQGEARISIEISGDQVTRTGRYVLVPEAWQREELDRSTALRIAKTALGLPLAALVIALVVLAVLRAVRAQVDMRWLWRVAALMFVASLASSANNWQLIGLKLNTTQPLASQLWILAAFMVLGALFQALLVGLLAGVAVRAAHNGDLPTGLSPRQLGWGGWALGALLACGVALAQHQGAAWEPQWASYNALNPQWGALQVLIGDGSTAVSALVALTALQALLHSFSQGFTRRRGAAVVVWLLLGAACALGSHTLGGLALASMGAAVGLALLYVLALRFEPMLLPVLLCSVAVLDEVELAVLSPHANATLYAGLGIVVWVVATVWWLGCLRRARTLATPT